MNYLRSIGGAAIVVAVALALAGCGSNVTAQSADWYKDHGPERGAMLAKCDADPGQLAATADCINAKSAQEAVTWQATQGVGSVAPVTFGAPAASSTSKGH